METNNPSSSSAVRPYSRPLAIFQGFLSGALAVIAMLMIMAALRLFFAIPTPTEMIFDRLFPLTPISVFLGSLGFFGGYTPLKIAGVTGSLVGHLLVGGLGGVVYALVIRKRRAAGRSDHAPGVIIIGVLVAWAVVAGALWPNLLTNYHGHPPATATLLTLAGMLTSFAVAGLGVFVFFHLIARQSQPLPASRDTMPGADFTRRRFVATGLGAAFAVGLGVFLRRLYDMGTFSYDGTEYNGPKVQKITPNDEFYSVSKNLGDPQINADVWRLEIAGLVDEPRQYTLPELRALPSITQEATILCISFRVGGGLASNALWQGVPLKTLLAAARPKAEKIAAILFHAADGYYETFPYDKAMEETTILAYQMNGADLPPKHGYPVRLIVPGLYGEKNCKWITQVELVAADDARLLKTHGCGFYKEQGWGPNFTVPTHSFFSAPQVRRDGHFNTAFAIGQAVTLRGVAIGGDRGISKVELSMDDGKTWDAVTITEPGTKIAWSIWEHVWTPAKAGDYTMVVRATDGNGDLQIAETRGTVPQGSTGLHKVKASVKDAAELKAA